MITPQYISTYVKYFGLDVLQFAHATWHKKGRCYQHLPLTTRKEITMNAPTKESIKESLSQIRDTSAPELFDEALIEMGYEKVHKTLTLTSAEG